MTKEQELARADSMEPIQGTVEVDIPIDTLWECFRHANLWPRWNKCFFWASNKDLVLGDRLTWVFQPIKWYLPYKMGAIANIVELEPRKKVTWEVTALPGFYARHTYHVEDLGGGRSRFGSYEKAMGWGFKLTKWFWLKHFTFVKDESLAGAKKLEQIYKQSGELREHDLPPKSYVRFIVVSVLILLAVLGLACVIAWMYFSFARQAHVMLAPNVYAVLGGGGNSLVVHDAGEAVLVDTKFEPGARTLRRWIDRDLRLHVTTVVNTHHHYDHTRGNPLYPGARFISHQNAPGYMCQRPRDAHWCAQHPSAIPTEFVQAGNRDSASAKRLFIGETELRLFHPGTAHTHDDVCVFLPKYNIVMTGDLVFFGYYPFIDTTAASGASLPGTIAALRKLAADFPDATFVPGHGPLAKAADLRSYADYLEDLDTQVRRAVREGKSEDEAARSVDLRRWDRKILPSFPDDRLIPEWATADSNIRSAYQLARGS